MNALLSQGLVRGDWTGGFWKDRWDTCRDHMVPHMWQLYQDTEIAPAWNNFRIAIGEVEGEHDGPPFWDGDVYKWLEGAIRVYGGSDDKAWHDELDRIIATIAQVQREDGYIFTYDAIQKRNNNTYQALGNDLNFEVYNMGHLMSAGVMHHRMTGKTSLLDLGKEAAGYLSAQFGNLEEATPRTAICPSHYMGLADMYRLTGDEGYIDLLQKLIDMRDLVPEGNDDNQDRIPTKEQREIVGHGVRATYLYAGLADLYMARGDEDYRVVLESVWNDLVSRKMYITGGCAPLYDGVSPYGVANRALTQTTHQSFGRAYELPNTAGYNETCASIGGFLWHYRMSMAFGEAKYGDQMERALYNTILTGIDLDGDAYFYQNALRCRHDLPYELKWHRHRAPFITSFCCPPNVVRTLAGTPDKIGIIRDGGAAFLLYGEGAARFERPDGQVIAFSMRSDYPWDGEIEITLDHSDVEGAFPVYLRIPAWAESHEVRVNGAPAEAVQGNDGFLKLSRDWSAGDRITLSLPMAPALIESHPMVEENRNHLAVQRGPIVYCLESADLPEGVSVEDVYISPDAQLEFSKAEIAGVEMGVLSGEFWVRRTPDWSGDTLYRKRDTPRFDSITARLVPYFAWDNRDEGEMTVWLPARPVT